MDKEKKRILVHIGLAKTGTTTLQTCLFFELHHRGLVNYYGRVGLDDKNQSLEWKTIGDAIINNKILNPNEIILKSDKVNIFSDEHLSVPKDYHELIGNKGVGMKEICTQIRNGFCSMGATVTILIVLRNQQTMIPSFFNETYKYYSRKNIKSYNCFVDNVLEKPVEFDSFNYEALVKNYIETFGKENVKMLFYEDLESGKDIFCSKLSEALGLEEQMVRSLIMDKRLNTKKRTGNGVLVDVPRIELMQNIPTLIRKSTSLSNVIDSDMFLTRLLKKIYLGVYTKSVEIPTIDETTKNRIFSYYKESNKNLAGLINIEEEKLLEYGYI